MKKSTKKLALNRETLRALEQLQLEGVGGGGSFWECGSTTIEASGCDTRCTCTSAYC